MSTPRLILVGGFLGAGKTTLLVRAAELLRKEGLSVALITNDQDQGLVDTLFGTTGSAFDWFLAGLTDVVKHKTTGEVQTTIS